MVELTYVASTALMGLFLVAVTVGVRRSYQQGTPSTVDRPMIGSGQQSEFALPGEAVVGRLARDPAAWTAGFLLLALGAAGGSILVVTPGVSATIQRSVGFLLGGGLLALLLAFVFLGVYSGARNRGLHKAQGVAAGSLMLGLLLVGVVIVRLIVW